MLSVDHLRLFCFLFISNYLLKMTTSTTKTCWPELVGKTADEAVQVIKEESGRKICKKKFLDFIRLI
jgi:hypothetical protein